MTTNTTTFSRILTLYDEERQLLDRCSCGEWIARDDLRRFGEIRAALEQLWPKRRAELVFSQKGPPRLISAPNEKARARAIAHGIAPLPGGQRTEGRGLRAEWALSQAERDGAQETLNPQSSVLSPYDSPQSSVLVEMEVT